MVTMRFKKTDSLEIEIKLRMITDLGLSCTY